jgi:hypothetical protein
VLQPLSFAISIHKRLVRLRVSFLSLCLFGCFFVACVLRVCCVFVACLLRVCCVRGLSRNKSTHYYAVCMCVVSDSLIRMYVHVCG